MESNEVVQAKCPHGVVGHPQRHDAFSLQFGGDWKIDFFECESCILVNRGYPKLAYRVGVPGERPQANAWSPAEVQDGPKMAPPVTGCGSAVEADEKTLKAFVEVIKAS